MSKIVALYDVYNNLIGNLTVTSLPYVGDSVEYNSSLYKLVRFKRPVLQDYATGDRFYRFICILQ